MRANLQILDEQCLDFGNQQLVREQKASHLSHLSGFCCASNLFVSQNLTILWKYNSILRLTTSFK